MTITLWNSSYWGTSWWAVLDSAGA